MSDDVPLIVLRISVFVVLSPQFLLILPQDEAKSGECRGIMLRVS